MTDMSAWEMSWKHTEEPIISSTIRWISQCRQFSNELHTSKKSNKSYGIKKREFLIYMKLKKKLFRSYDVPPNHVVGSFVVQMINIFQYPKFLSISTALFLKNNLIKAKAINSVLVSIIIYQIIILDLSIK